MVRNKSSLLTTPDKDVLTASITKCFDNGERILDDAQWVEFLEPPATKLMLSMIAQEEFAKAFLLFMVREEVIRWSPSLLRAMNDHACKQLVGMIIDYIEPRWETVEDLKLQIEKELDLGEMLPADVSSAINILRHEKIGRWESNTWEWIEPPLYESSALKIAEGKRDRLKQDALYVRLGRDGGAVKTPNDICTDDVEREYERARSYRSFLANLVETGTHESDRFRKVRECLLMLFEDN